MSFLEFADTYLEGDCLDLQVVCFYLQVTLLNCEDPQRFVCTQCRPRSDKIDDE